MGSDNTNDNDNDNDNDNEASGSGSNAADIIDNRADIAPDDTISENDIQQQPRFASTTSENFTAAAVEAAPATLKCRAFPHGVYSVIISFWSGFAWLICLSQDGCDYARVTGSSVADITNNPSTPFIDAGFSHYRAPVLENGVWVLDMSVPCQAYNTDIVNIGAAAQFAKVASFMATVLGGAGAIFIWHSLCIEIDRVRWRWLAIEFLLASVLQALSFTSFASSLCQTNVCAMDFGARANLLACIMWALVSFLLICYAPSARVKSSAQQLQSQVDMPDRNTETGNQTGTAAPGVPELT